MVRYAASVGLKPQELFGLTFAQFNNYIIGTNENESNKIKQSIATAIYSGYYAGYYNNEKHPKMPQDWIKEMHRPEAPLLSKKEFTGQALAVRDMVKRIGI